jgi:Zn-finger nucleic acid-binding protein
MSKIEVTLAKALKRKNELVQLINEKKSIITRYNSYDNRQQAPYKKKKEGFLSEIFDFDF